MGKKRKEMMHFQRSTPSLIFKLQPLLFIIFHVKSLRLPCFWCSFRLFLVNITPDFVQHLSSTITLIPAAHYANTQITLCFIWVMGICSSHSVSVQMPGGKYAAGFWGLMQFVYLAESEQIERRERGFFQNPAPGFVFASGEVWAAVGGCQHEHWNNYCSMLA